MGVLCAGRTTLEATVEKNLTDQIAASIEDVRQLLADNRSLSIAFLSRRLRDLEDELRRVSKGHICPCKHVVACEETIKRLGERIELAGVRFKEMQSTLDLLKGK